MRFRHGTICIHWLGAKVGGGITYLRAVLPELIAQLTDKDVRLILLLPAPLNDHELPDWVEVCVLPLAARNSLTRLIFDQLVLPILVKLKKVDALFCSGSFSPIVKNSPTITLLRNAIYFDDEFLERETVKHRLTRRIQRWLIQAGAVGCHRIVYPSVAMRQLVEKKIPILQPFGAINHYGISALFEQHHARRTLHPEKVEVSHAPLTFLYVMNYTLQKNLGYLLNALALAKQEGLPVRVVVTSRLDHGPQSCYATDRAVIESHDLIGSGYLQAVGQKFGEDLLTLYQSVDACIFPSICESFGHPLVEAMAMGKPLICADRPYAHELCGDYATYVDPLDATQLVKVWRDWTQTGKPLAPACDDLAERFSWKTHTAQLVEWLSLGEGQSIKSKQTNRVTALHP